MKLEKLENIKIVYVNSIEKIDYDYLPIYKKCDNDKYLQLCIQKLSIEIIKENADPTDLILAIDNFSKSVFNILKKKLNVEFVEDDDEKKLIINKYRDYQNDNIK